MTASSSASLKTLFFGFPGWGCGVTDPISTKLNPIWNWFCQQKKLYSGVLLTGIPDKDPWFWDYKLYPEYYSENQRHSGIFPNIETRDTGLVIRTISGMNWGIWGPLKIECPRQMSTLFIDRDSSG